MSKGGGTFLIDHPLDPYNKVLRHSFVESPDMLNIYNGIVECTAETVEITLPDYFLALNKDFKYQLTPIGTEFIPFISEEISTNRFKISNCKTGYKVSWQVTGIRQDRFALANPVIVEQNKETPGYIHEYLWN